MSVRSSTASGVVMASGDRYIGMPVMASVRDSPPFAARVFTSPKSTTLNHVRLVDAVSEHDIGRFDVAVDQMERVRLPRALRKPAPKGESPWLARAGRIP